MRKAGSLIPEIADCIKVPAGSALAVDRVLFAQAVTEKIKSHPLISIKNEEVKAIPLQEKVIIATGPLTSDALAAEISKSIQENIFTIF